MEHEPMGKYTDHGVVCRVADMNGADKFSVVCASNADAVATAARLNKIEQQRDDLLAALELAECRIESLWQNRGSTATCRVAYESDMALVRAAIAQAEGGAA